VARVFKRNIDHNLGEMAEKGPCGGAHNFVSITEHVQRKTDRRYTVIGKHMLLLHGE
jgi:hypothetical protein